MTESEIEKELKVFDKELDAIIAIKEKIESSFCKSKETDKNEERKFQIKILELQLKYDNAKWVTTIIFGILVSLSAVFSTITFSGVFPKEIVPVATEATELFILATVLCAVVGWLLLYISQKIDLKSFRTDFIKKDTSEPKAKK
jgi:hypothetical protein